MNSTILLGPLVGLVGAPTDTKTDNKAKDGLTSKVVEDIDVYTLSLLSSKDIHTVQFLLNGELFPASKVAETFSGYFWAVTIKVKINGNSQRMMYKVLLNGVETADNHGLNKWEFYIPAKNEEPCIAYASCNGFSSADLAKNTANPYGLWKRMQQNHAAAPFSLLIMGGDQLYADEIWYKVDELHKWTELSEQEQFEFEPSENLPRALDSFYEQLYLRQWNRPEVAMMLASVPTIMMWDDHDIFDGWGSYGESFQQCKVYQLVFQYARKYFEIFQLRCREQDKMLSPVPGSHYAYGVNFRSYGILAMDHRTQRSLDRIMGEDQWEQIIKWLNEVEFGENLLVLSGVPVVYRDFGSIEQAVDFTFWKEEVSDDLKDHWRAKEHQGERLRFIHQFLDELKLRRSRKNNTGRTVILSGDVHVGCLGVIMDRRDIPQKIHQVVSSGIVHPSPTWIQWAGILATTNDSNEYLNEDKKLETAILKPIGSDTYIRARNFATLQMGTDKKLWINWINESKDKPQYPLE
ncbi:MAG TPA: alkaline phosphatase D family protein [Catalimonadaceae bacterium]|nr:alkaline phosphatase D family protein [Catalimonadaceae bacterium]